MTPISICVIAKNEEKHIETFLSSIENGFKNVPHEIVLVDTGSSDATFSIAQKYTDKIYHFEWNDDFSAARNFSLSCASYEWVLVLDCDEYIIHLDPEGLMDMAERYPGAVGLISRKNHFMANGNDNIYIDNVERFFNRKTFYYEAIVHEQVHAHNGYNFMRINIPLIAEHYGYYGSLDELRPKMEQKNKLLFKELDENPNDPYLYLQLGCSFLMLQDNEKACCYFEKALEYQLDPKAEYVQQLVIDYGYTLLCLKRYENALQFKNIYDKFATTADFVCLMGFIYLKNGMNAEAMEEFRNAATFSGSRLKGANSFIPIYQMGYINEMLGDTDNAAALYKQCGDYKPALDRLKELGI